MKNSGSGSAPQLWEKSAREVVDLLRAREISPGQLLDSVETRITAVNPVVNALPTLCLDHARSRLKSTDAKELSASMLAGLPVPIKDSIRVAGVRSTFGSTIFSDHYPDKSDYVVEKLENNGALVYAKSNTPEFEAGANTFNNVFGATLNPWNTKLSTGGSSGGAAAAIATGMAWCAIGTDFGCSLRNPAALCGIVGLRPTPGLVPQGPNNTPYQNLSVTGPMARTVEDTALMLDAISGKDDRDPLTFSIRPGQFSDAVLRPVKAAKVAFSVDLGVTSVDPEISAIVRNALDQISNAGFHVREDHPDLRDSHDTFQILRAFQFASAWGHLLPEHANTLKPEVVWNIEQGTNLKTEDVIRADRTRAELRRRAVAFLEDTEFLITPTSIVAAYPVEQRFVEECNGVKFENYVQWMAIAYTITLTSLPAISVPCGITSDGRPVGMQIIGRHRSEARLLAFARTVERHLGVVSGKPIDTNAVPNGAPS